MNDASFDVAIRSENCGLDIGGLENLMDIAGNNSLTGRAGDTDKFE